MKHARDIVIADRVLGSGDGPLVCVPLVGRDRESILDEVAGVARLEPDLIEWRADYFDHVAATGDVLALLREIRDAAQGIPLIFTLRSHREGGEPVDLDDAGVMQLYAEVCQSGLVALVDFEMSAGSDQVGRVRTAARHTDTKLILSYHNFAATPDRALLRDRFSAAEALGADIAKVAVMPHDIDDVLTLLAATLEASRATDLPLISIAMGPIGALTRVLGWYFGSSVTFAAAGRSSAPGQLSVEAVRKVLQALQEHLPAVS